jgi:hypothetical protein
MRWKQWESSRIRSGICIAFVAATVLFAGACGSSSEPDCSDSGYSAITFYYSDGTVVSDLSACTNKDQSQTIIDNESSDTVWYLSIPAGITYWPAASDLDDFNNGNLSAAVALFRIGVRNVYHPPALTIEPDVKAVLDISPGLIQLKQDPGEQATWEVASLLVDSSSDKAQDAIVSLLKTGSSETDTAMTTCMSSGYTIGKNLADAGDSDQQIQSQLSSELGVYQATNECGEAIEEAQNDSASHGELPELKLSDVAEQTHEDPDYANAGHLINEAEDAAHDLLKIHE